MFITCKPSACELHPENHNTCNAESCTSQARELQNEGEILEALADACDIADSDVSGSCKL